MDRLLKWLERYDRETWLRIGVAIVVVLALVGFWVYNLLRDPDVDGWWKVGVVAAVALVGGVVLAVILSALNRYSEAVQRWTYAIAVLVVATVCSTVPLLVLNTEDQRWGLAVLGIWLLALFPGFLYLQFRAVRGRSLLEEFIHHLDALDIDEYGDVPEPTKVAPPKPAPSTSGADPAARAADLQRRRREADEHRNAMRSLYVRKFQGVYGMAPELRSNGSAPAKGGRPVRVRGDTLWPILWVTIFAAIGWSTVLAPDSVLKLRPFGSGFSLNNPTGVADPLRAGFVGAYFYVVQMLVRRYFQKDLKPDAYVSAMLRLVVVPLIVAVAHVAGLGALGGDLAMAVAFFIGVFPQVGMEVIRRGVAKGLGRAVPSLRTEYPLSQIDGLNLFYEARLLEEGIEDMQNLATADFVELLLHTRIPVGRLVDWMDQTHLFVRMAPVENPKNNGKTGKNPKNNGKTGENQTDSGKTGNDATQQPAEHPRDKLRRLGIRCATDLELAVKGANGQLDELKEALPGVDFVLLTLQQEPNMEHVRAWKGRNGAATGGRPMIAAAG